jgi:uncharacterized membrane protein YcaP (DUF421 family)
MAQALASGKPAQAVAPNGAGMRCDLEQREIIMPDWGAMFKPELAISEVVLRATIMYLFLFLVMRFLLKREGGTVNIADLLVVVAVVDGAQPAFSGEAQSITESALFVLTILFWSYALNWLSYHISWMRFLASAPPLVLVSQGKMNRANLRQALMTRDELMQQLREQGIEDLQKAHRVVLEGNGEISVIKTDDA